MLVPKNSVGVGAFGPAVTRFVPPGYHPEAAGEPMVDKTRRVAEGLSDLLDGLEYHYPGERGERRGGPHGPERARDGPARDRRRAPHRPDIRLGRVFLPYLSGERTPHLEPRAPSSGSPPGMVWRT